MASEIARRTGKWRAGAYQRAIDERPERRDAFETGSGVPVAPLYTPDDLTHHDYLRDEGFPGRGVGP